MQNVDETVIKQEHNTVKSYNWTWTE